MHSKSVAKRQDATGSRHNPKRRRRKAKKQDRAASVFWDEMRYDACTRPEVRIIFGRH